MSMVAFRLPILTAWAGGPTEVALAGMKKEQIEQAAVLSLAGLLNQRPQSLRSLIEGFLGPGQYRRRGNRQRPARGKAIAL